MTGAEIALLTVQTPLKYFMSDRVICRTPRVVGIDTGSEVLWSPTQIPDRPNLRYSRKRLEEIVMSPDGLFRERLIGFFATYLAEQSGGHEKDFNCHLFGRWMIGAPLATPENGTEGPTELIVKGERTDTLEHGQRGIVGGLWFGRKPDAAHSVIGLGGELAIQIDGWQGPMRITSQEEAVQKYISPIHQVDEIYRAGVYVDAKT